MTSLLRNSILIAGLLIVFMFASCTAAKPPSIDTLKELGMQPIPGDREVPNISFRELDGTPVSLEDYRGSVVLLNFWASWCPPCRAEMPSMGRLAEELKGGDFIMIPINVQEPPALVRAFIEEYEVDFPVYLDEQAEAARAMGVNGLPTTVLIDRNGYAVALAVGALEWDDEAVIDMFKDWTR